jgi:hypothetical protein
MFSSVLGVTEPLFSNFLTLSGTAWTTSLNKWQAQVATPVPITNLFNSLNNMINGVSTWLGNLLFYPTLAPASQFAYQTTGQGVITNVLTNFQTISTTVNSINANIATVQATSLPTTFSTGTLSPISLNLQQQFGAFGNLITFLMTGPGLSKWSFANAAFDAFMPGTPLKDVFVPDDVNGVPKPVANFLTALGISFTPATL